MYSGHGEPIIHVSMAVGGPGDIKEYLDLIWTVVPPPSVFFFYDGELSVCEVDRQSKSVNLSTAQSKIWIVNH